ncbi:MAG: hypothetical protein AAF967_06705 [Pseudomonadota bacterium]
MTTNNETRFRRSPKDGSWFMGQRETARLFDTDAASTNGVYDRIEVRH